MTGEERGGCMGCAGTKQGGESRKKGESKKAYHDVREKRALSSIAFLELPRDWEPINGQ